MQTITESMLEALRAQVTEKLSPYRMAHTLGVERMAARLAALYVPEKEPLLRAAALLHDVTKEYSEAEQLQILESHGASLCEADMGSPAVWHGITAALIIPDEYPAFADPEIISAVRWHTTGCAGMTLTDALLNLADFIEEERQFPDCVALRNAFFEPSPEEMSPKERLAHLRRILILYYEKTLSKLQASGRPICPDSLAALESMQNRREF